VDRDQLRLVRVTDQQIADQDKVAGSHRVETDQAATGQMVVADQDQVANQPLEPVASRSDETISSNVDQTRHPL